jgi:CBS domain-containing protein
MLFEKKKEKTGGAAKEPAMKIKNAMNMGVTRVDPHRPVEQLARLMRDKDIGAIRIGENDRLVGMVTDRDIVCRCIAAGLDPKTATARDVMTDGIIFCLDKQEVDDTARLMERRSCAVSPSSMARSA